MNAPKRAGPKRRIAFLVAAGLLLGIGPLSAVELGGQVVGVSDGRAVSGAAVTLSYGVGVPGPTAVTVFTDESGQFKFPVDVASPNAGSSLHIKKLGYRQVSSRELDG